MTDEREGAEERPEENEEPAARGRSFSIGGGPFFPLRLTTRQEEEDDR